MLEFYAVAYDHVFYAFAIKRNLSKEKEVKKLYEMS